MIGVVERELDTKARDKEVVVSEVDGFLLDDPSYGVTSGRRAGACRVEPGTCSLVTLWHGFKKSVAIPRPIKKQEN